MHTTSRRRCAILLAGLAWALPLAADPKPAAPAERPVLGETYADPFQGFSLRVPFHWQEGPAMKGASVTFVPRSVEGYAPRIAVLVKASTKSLLDDFASLRQEFALGFPDGVLSPDRPFQVADKQALQFEVTFRGEGQPLHGVETCIDSADGVRYYVLVTVPQAAYEALAKPLKAAIESFRCLKREAISQEARDRFRQSLDRGMASYKAGRVEDAIREFQAAATAVPQHPLPHNNLAAIYATQKNLDAAIREYQAVVALKPDSAHALFNLASMLRQKQKYEDAVAAYEKVLELDPEHAEANTNLGALYQLKGQMERAEAALRRAIELDPASPTAHFNLGQIYVERGNSAGARTEFEKTLKLAPDHKLAKEALAKLDQGK